MSRQNEVNRIILDKIKKADTSEEIKKFLQDALFFELERDGEGMPRYTSDYQRMIAEATKGGKGR